MVIVAAAMSAVGIVGDYLLKRASSEAMAAWASNLRGRNCRMREFGGNPGEGLELGAFNCERS